MNVVHCGFASLIDFDLPTGTHEPQSYTPLTNEQSDENLSEEGRISVYEDGRSANHISEIDYEIDNTSERKTDTPDLIRKSDEETTENTPSQNENGKESVTLESSNVTEGTADEGYESRKNVHSYIEILPDETEESVGGNADGFAYATTNTNTRTHDKAEGQISNDYDDTTLSRKDQGKDSSRRYSRHVRSESDYETVRSSQLQSSVIDSNDDDDFDSDFDDISESNYAHLHEFLDEVEYWNGEWAKSFQALQRMFHPKNKVRNS